MRCRRQNGATIECCNGPTPGLAWRTGLAVLIVASVIATIDGAEHVQARAESGSAVGRRFALLIGVGRYAHLPASEQLDGCGNDVEAMKALLQDRFHFASPDITTLVDEQATGFAIRRALSRLAAQVHAVPAGDNVQVVLHFSGHGSQVADQPEGHVDSDEEDGLDETLVPYDAKAQGGEQDIRDDELNAFAESICTRDTVRLCIVLDCCHSGSGARGTTKLRRLSRGLRTLPDDEPTARKITPKRLPERAIMLSACRAQEVEPEYHDGDKTYGLLTRFLVQTLMQSREVSTLNYDQLRTAILNGYFGSAGLTQVPLPQLEGRPSELRSIVLSAGVQNDLPPQYAVEPLVDDPNRAKLAAGSFHGITVGSIYEVVDAVDAVAVVTAPRPNADADDALLLQIEKVDGADSRGRLLRGTGEDQTEARWPRTLARAAALERYRSLGDAGLRVAVVRGVNQTTDGPRLAVDDPAVSSVKKAIELAQRPNESRWLTWVADDAAVDLVLRIDGDRAAFFPSSGRPQVLNGTSSSTVDVGSLLRGGWGPINLKSADAPEKLADHLRRISRARNLIRLAAAQATTAEGRASSTLDSGVALELVRVRIDPQAGVVPDGVWPQDDQSAMVMKEGDLYALRLRNPTAKPLYATVLIVGPDLDIQIAFPGQAGVGLVDEQRLRPNEERLSDGFMCDDIAGERFAVVLATSTPNDLTYVAQDGLPRVRSTVDALQQLLLEQTAFRTRGDKRIVAKGPAENRWSAAVLRWESRP